MLNRRFRLFAVLLVSGLLAIETFGADSVRTIRVTGTGRVPIKPDEIELQLDVAGSAQLASEALKKYNQALKQARDAFTGLKMANLEFKPLGVSVKQIGQNPNQIFNGQPQENSAAQVTFGRSVRVSLKGIGELDAAGLSEVLVKLIDTAKDSGASIKSQNDQLSRIYGTQMTNAMAYFVVNGVDEAREKSYEQAMKTARQRAERLAKLSNATVGNVHTISESFAEPKDSENAQMRVIYAVYGMQQGEKDDHRVLSSEYKDVDVEVTLTVDFEIE
ncbi:MAG: SIMPL domain-containing protein [Planctomycetales bacterium]|nr:SIMPL domain-containing protein [Planctomycetales bacterium]